MCPWADAAAADPLFEEVVPQVLEDADPCAPPRAFVFGPKTVFKRFALTCGLGFLPARWRA